MSPKRSIFLFNLFSFFSALDFYLPIKVVYFYQVTGSYSTTASIISFVWIAQALLEVPTGIFSDLIGRKKTMVLGALCSVFGYFLYAAGLNYWFFVLGSFLEGAARAFFSGNNNAYLHNLLSDKGKIEQYHHYFGKIGSVVATGGVLAALASGLIFQWSSAFFMWVNIIPQFLALICALLLVEIKHEEIINTNIYQHLKTAILEIKNNTNLRNISLSEVLGGGGLAAFEFQAAVYAAVWPTWAVGFARAVQEFGGIPSSYFAGKIIDKLGLLRVLTFNWIAGYAGNILAALSHSVFSPVFIMLSLPLYGAGEAANQKVLQKEFTEKQRATIPSLTSLGNSISFSIALYLCGIVANQYGPFIGLLATQICLVPSAYFYFRFLQKLRYNS